MTERSLRQAIRRGQGKVVIYLRDHGADPWREVLLDVCSHTQAFDWQMEDRSEYLWRLVSLLSDINSFLETLTHILVKAKPLSSHRKSQRRKLLMDRQQMLDILNLAKLYERIVDIDQVLASIREVRDPYEIAWTPKFAGIKGLQLAAELADHLDGWQAGCVYEDSVKALGKREVRRQLRIVSQLHPSASRIREYEPPLHKPQTTDALDSAEAVVAAIQSRRLLRKRHLELLSESDWNQLQGLAFTSKKVDEVRGIARAFRVQERPFGDRSVELLDKVLDEPNKKLKLEKFWCLEYSVNDDLRIRGLHFLDSDDEDSRWFGMHLLEKNMRQEDLPKWEAFLRKLARREEEFHTAAMITLDMEVLVPTTLWRFIFGRLPCLLCRGSVVRKLRERRALTMQDLLELAEDADEDNRKLAKKWLARKQGKAGE